MFKFQQGFAVGRSQGCLTAAGIAIPDADTGALAAADIDGSGQELESSSETYANIARRHCVAAPKYGAGNNPGEQNEKITRRQADAGNTNI